MKVAPPIWSRAELETHARQSADAFRAARLAPTRAWTVEVAVCRARFEQLFETLGSLGPQAMSPETLAEAWKANLGDALRYLCGPPVSDDDLKVLADVTTVSPGSLASDPARSARIFDIITATIDPHRFPWVAESRPPTTEERSAALLASSVLLASQRLSTSRRHHGKTEQEALVKAYLRTQGFEEVAAAPITTLVEGPGPGQFCSECLLGTRKADVVVRMRDTRFLAIECKVSNSALNSVKRINNDAAAKAVAWLRMFGTHQVVPTAVISGVFKAANLVQAQDAGLTLFWAHDLNALGTFLAGD